VDPVEDVDFVDNVDAMGGIAKGAALDDGSME
jgi:hypothetical protein